MTLHNTLKFLSLGPYQQPKKTINNINLTSNHQTQILNNISSNSNTYDNNAKSGDMQGKDCNDIKPATATVTTLKEKDEEDPIFRKNPMREQERD